MEQQATNNCWLLLQPGVRVALFQSEAGSVPWIRKEQSHSQNWSHWGSGNKTREGVQHTQVFRDIFCSRFGFSRRHARIELSTKVCDSYGKTSLTSPVNIYHSQHVCGSTFSSPPERIRATLIHEMCHAATWIIDGIKGGGHGAQWKAW